MKIFNIMLSRKLGGIEQSFLDYKKIIELCGYESFNIISNNALIARELKTFETVPNFFQYDPITILKIRKLIKQHKPKFIIAHGSRIMNFANLAKIGLKVQVVGVSHQYKIKPLLNCDHVISITEHMKQYLIDGSILSNNITVIPNCISVHKEYAPAKPMTPIIIGAMGRFVKKKGFDILLHAFKLLKDHGIQFKGVIAGYGEENANLKQLCEELGLNSHVTFPGWIKNKEDFFDNIDIFCLPSTHEPFGIILLEAMAFSKPVVTTDSEGPLEIIEEGESGIFCQKEDPDSMVQAIVRLINDPEYCSKLAENAYLRVYNKYGINNAADKFKELLKKLI